MAVVYHIAHLVGLIFLFVGFGAMTGGYSKTGMKYHGIGLLILLVAGFGLIARIGPTMPAVVSYTAPFVIAKIVIFLILGVLPVLLKRGVLPASAVVLLAVILGGCAAYLGYVKALPF